MGIELSNELRARASGLQDALRPRLRGARWVPAANLHLTLRFVGETPPERADSLRVNLREPIRREAAIELAFSGLGCFPRVEKPRKASSALHSRCACARRYIISVSLGDG